MTAGSSTTAAAGAFAHSAFVYHDDTEYAAVLAPFVREGLAVGEHVLVVAEPSRLAVLRSALGGDADRVEFGDMLELGRNPARIIPLWQQFLDRSVADGRGARGIGEPVHGGRCPHELSECVQHEALLNVAFDGGPGWSLVCPYRAGQVSTASIAAAHHTHPTMVSSAGWHACDDYGVDVRHPELLAGPTLPRPPGGAPAMCFGVDRLHDVRVTVHRLAAEHGIDARRAADLELAISEIATNSVLHGGGRGRLRWWVDDGALVCEVVDGGRVIDPLAGRRRPNPASIGGYGLWLANSICDLVQIRSSSTGTTVRAHMRLAA